MKTFLRRFAAKAIFMTLALLALAAISIAIQGPPAALSDGQVINLWSGTAPGALGNDPTDIPSLTAYLPRTMTESTPAVIVCPGGSYRGLATNHEGRQVAGYLNGLGVAAFVLRYRLGPRYHHPIELGDAQRAIRSLRVRAGEWRLDPTRIGIMGFSAGGHLAMSASTLFDSGDLSAPDPIDRVSSRPDFAILAYPVISMTASWTHAGSKQNLLGDTPDEATAKRLSGELAVSADVPQTFIFQTNEDTVVPAENSLHYFLALRRAGIPAELHVFEKGAHGVGLAYDNPSLAPWSALLATWLRGRHLVR